MAGCDGDRGWLNYLAVDEDSRHRGLGRRLMAEVESGLLALGLRVRATNSEALAFYEQPGFTRDDVVTLGRRLERDDRGMAERMVQWWRRRMAVNVPTSAKP